MPKSRRSKRARTKKKVYTHQRERKEGKTPTIHKETLKHLDGLIKHSIEVLKLKIEIVQEKNQIAMCARNNDVMDHFIEDYKTHLVWFKNKVNEHIKACITKMTLFLGENSKKLIIPENFHLGSTDLKNGYVTLLDKEDNEWSIILSDPPAEFPNDIMFIGSVIRYNENLKLPSLLVNADVISTILCRKASILEDKYHSTEDKWHCSSVMCQERKPKINFKDL